MFTVFFLQKVLSDDSRKQPAIQDWSCLFTVSAWIGLSCAL